MCHLSRLGNIHRRYIKWRSKQLSSCFSSKSVYAETRSLVTSSPSCCSWWLGWHVAWSINRYLMVFLSLKCTPVAGYEAWGFYSSAPATLLSYTNKLLRLQKPASRLAVESLPVNPVSAIKYLCAAEVDPNERFYTAVMTASVWDFKLSLSHTERGSDAEQAGGLIHDLNITSSIDIFLVLALAVSSKCLPISQAVLMNCGKVLLMMQV